MLLLHFALANRLASMGRGHFFMGRLASVHYRQSCCSAFWRHTHPAAGHGCSPPSATSTAPSPVLDRSEAETSRDGPAKRSAADAGASTSCLLVRHPPFPDVVCTRDGDSFGRARGFGRVGSSGSVLSRRGCSARGPLRRRSLLRDDETVSFDLLMPCLFPREKEAFFA